MKYTILTLFPEVVRAYCNESIVKRAIADKKISVDIVDIRDFTNDKHRTADDRPYGGGPGMVMKAEPILEAFQKAVGKQEFKGKTILLSAAGKPFSNVLARRYAKTHAHMVLIAGHYEGVDDRVKKILKAEEISVGPYVLTGGELPALIVLDATMRQMPGILGNKESVEEYRGGVGIPVYTRPEVLEYRGKKHRVPKELLSGNHETIRLWRGRKQRRASGR